MTSSGLGPGSRGRWAAIGLRSLAAAIALGTIAVGCRTASRPAAPKADIVVTTPPQVASLNDLATAVARVLDDRRNEASATLPSPQGPPAQPPPQPRPLEVTPAPPKPSPPDVDRMSVDELSAVVEQILRSRQPADAPDQRPTPPGGEVAASPSPAAPAAPATDPLVELVARALREQRAAEPPPTGADRPAAPDPPPNAPAQDQPADDPDEATLRALVRLLRQQRDASTPGAGPASTAPPKPAPPPTAPAPKAGRPLTVEELTRAIEKLLRESQQPATPPAAIPPRSATPSASKSRVWAAGRPPVALARAGAAIPTVRMQSAEPDPVARAGASSLDPGRARVPPSDAELALAIARVLRARSRSIDPAVAKAGFEGSEAAEPPSKPAVPSSTVPPSTSSDTGALARRVAIAIKARRQAEAVRAPPLPTSQDVPRDPGEPASPGAFGVLPSSAPGGAGLGDPAGSIARGEAIAAGMGGDPFAFANPFEAGPSSACSTCGQVHAGSPGDGPGRPVCGASCYPFPAHSAVGRFFGELYQSICCPDPCYKPTWLPLANSAFFVDGIRPVTQQRIRYTGIFDLQAPDRNEFFFARADGNGPGPTPLAGRATVYRRGKGIHLRTRPFLPSVDINQVSLYTEAANADGTISAFVEIPYQTVQGGFYPFGARGSANLNAGTKSILFDSPPLQIAFQFRTYAPIGPVNRGLSNGHVTLEPSLIAALRLSDRTYLQAQLAEWIPLGGTPDYQGSILDYHFSLNHQIWQINPDIPLIGTLEYGGYSFQTGGYSTFAEGTEPGTPGTQLYTIRHSSSGGTYSNIATGLRMVVCNKIDFGAALAYPVGSPNWTNPQVVAEFRWRF